MNGTQLGGLTVLVSYLERGPLGRAALFRDRCPHVLAPYQVFAAMPTSKPPRAEESDLILADHTAVK